MGGSCLGRQRWPSRRRPMALQARRVADSGWHARARTGRGYEQQPWESKSLLLDTMCPQEPLVSASSVGWAASLLLSRSFWLDLEEEEPLEGDLGYPGRC